MDKQQLALLIPILALTIGLAGTIFHGLLQLQKARAKQSPAPPDDDVLARLEALEQEVGSLREQLVEAHERLDFAERLLARPPEQRGAADRRIGG
ncbi:MAG: hypothetical protein ACRD08_02315 [Acidimicrobiales bacterium]